MYGGVPGAKSAATDLGVHGRSASQPQMSRNSSSSSSWQDTGAASDGGWSNHAPVAPPPSSRPQTDHGDSWATQEASTASRLSPAAEKATTGTFAGFEGAVVHAQWNHMLSICLQSTAC